MTGNPKNGGGGRGQPKFKADYLEATREFWQPYADRQLTREDAREMAHNLIGFFNVLREWKAAEAEQGGAGIESGPDRSLDRKQTRVRKRALTA